MKRHVLLILIAVLAVPFLIEAETPQSKMQSPSRIRIVKKALSSDAPVQSKLRTIEGKMVLIETELNELKNEIEGLKGKIDSMNEMSEMTSLRLQMMMDRRSKFVETLSNIMKKISTTSDSIVQNMK